MSPVVITLLFLAFAIVMFILEKIPFELAATIVAIGLKCDRCSERVRHLCRLY